MQMHTNYTHTLHRTYTPHNIPYRTQTMHMTHIHKLHTYNKLHMTLTNYTYTNHMHIYTYTTHYEQTKHDYTDVEYRKNIQLWNFFFFEKAWLLWKLEGKVPSTKGQWAWTAVYLGNYEHPEQECLSEMWWESAGIRGTEAPCHTQLEKRERNRPQGNELRSLMSAMSSLWDQVDFCVDMNASVQGVIYQTDQLRLHLYKP